MKVMIGLVVDRLLVFVSVLVWIGILSGGIFLFGRLVFCVSAP